MCEFDSKPTKSTLKALTALSVQKRVHVIAPLLLILNLAESAEPQLTVELHKEFNLFRTTLVENQSESVAPASRYTNSMQMYLSAKQFAEEIEKPDSPHIIRQPSQENPSTGMRWITFAPKLEVVPETPEASRLQGEMCEDFDSDWDRLESEVDRRVALLEKYHEIKPVEEEAFWHRYYLNLSPAEQKEANFYLEQADEESNHSIYNYRLAAQESPVGFTVFLQRICRRYSATLSD